MTFLVFCVFDLKSAPREDYLYAYMDLATLGLRPIVDMAKVPRLLHALLDGLLMQKIVDAAAIAEDLVVQTRETLAPPVF